MNRLRLIVFTFAFTLGLAAQPAKKPEPTYTEVSYGPHERHRLDLWLAKSAQPTTLVVFIHGGGFVNGSEDAAKAEMLNAHG